jgi:hypothetical protein
MVGSSDIVNVLSTLNLTSDQFRLIWTNLFSSSPGTGVVDDPHLGLPTISNIQPGINIASITFSPTCAVLPPSAWMARATRSSICSVTPHHPRQRHARANLLGSALASPPLEQSTALALHATIQLCGYPLYPQYHLRHVEHTLFRNVRKHQPRKQNCILYRI